MTNLERIELHPSERTLIELELKRLPPLGSVPAAVYLASLSHSGRRTQRNALDTMAYLLIGAKTDALMCNWGQVRYQHDAAIRTKLAENYAPATANKMLSALRRVVKEAWKLGYTSAEDYHKVASVENVAGVTLPSGRELSTGEIAALLSSCQSDPTPAGVRDAALIAVLYSCGLRREEIINLNLSDNDPETQQLLVRGKGNKQRYAYLVEGELEALLDWLLIRGSDTGPLLWPVNKGGKMFNRRLTTQAIYNVLVKRGKDSQVKRFSPHDLRRTFVSHLLEEGADIAIVSKMAGHANVQTTIRYDRRPEDAKKNTANLLHVPYIKSVPPK